MGFATPIIRLLFKFKFLVKNAASFSTTNCLLAASERSVG